MNNITRLLIVLFAIMFFWVYSVEAFSATHCFKIGDVVRCIHPDGTVTTISKNT